MSPKRHSAGPGQKYESKGESEASSFVQFIDYTAQWFTINMRLNTICIGSGSNAFRVD